MAENSSITVRLSEDEKKALQTYAEENDLTLSQIVRRAIKSFLEKKE